MTPDGRITSEFDDTAIIEPEEDDELADLELVVLDLAGTTVIDDGLTERAFLRAADAAGLAASEGDRERVLSYLRRATGQSTAEVFRALTGDVDQSQHANAVFESAVAELVAAEGVRAVPGAADLVRLLRDAGVAVVLTTGFSRAALDVLLDVLGWEDLADLTLSAEEAGRGRPYPDLPLTALLRTGATSVAGMVVVGDTPSDVAAGIAAGAGLVVGVLSGTHDDRDLLDAGAHAVIDSVADLSELLGFEDDDELVDEEDDLADFDDVDELTDDETDDDETDEDVSTSEPEGVRSARFTAFAPAEGPAGR